jgi:hypothetical protein
MVYARKKTALRRLCAVGDSGSHARSSFFFEDAMIIARHAGHREVNAINHVGVTASRFTRENCQQKNRLGGTAHPCKVDHDLEARDG